VIACNTAFAYRGKPIDARQIGRELNVRYVLEGSVQRGGVRMRVNVQLIDAESGAHLWAERFDKPKFKLSLVAFARVALELGGVDIVRPDLRAVQDAQNSNPVGGNKISSDVGRTRNDQLPRPGDPARAAALRKVEEPPHRSDDLIVDIDRGTRVLGFNMFEDVVAVSQRVLRPDQPHD
jgi:hypothetical protein